jgi:eukaryotic-like serine/threonine-protein kinase
MSTVDVLSTVPGFASMDRADLESLAGQVHTATWEAEEVLMRRGDLGDAMHIVVSGGLRVPVFDDRGRQRLVARLGPGDVVGEMALLTGDRRNADVIADTRTETVVVARKTMLPLLEENPQLSRFLTEILGQRLEQSGGIDRVGKYRVLDKLGEGATSKVYEALHPGLNRTVALKMLGHHMVYDKTFRDRFITEARTIAGLSHPNIVQIFDTEQAYATWFIVMEKIDGGDLEALLRDSGPTDPATTADILLQLSRGLRYAHSQGIVHRDVKPANTAIEDNGAVKLMDFGIARRIQRDGERSAVVEGTPRYLAPEAIRGDPVDGRADIYSLGVMAFEMLVGQAPFIAKTMDGILRMHLAVPPPDIKRLRPGLPDGLRTFVTGALVKDPAKRLSNWEQILSLLEGGTGARLGQHREQIVRIRYRAKDSVRVDRAINALRDKLGDVDVAVASLSGPEEPTQAAPERKGWLARLTGTETESDANNKATRPISTDGSGK